MITIPEGRPVVFAAVVTGGLASAVFNIWGASQLFSGLAAIPFAVAVTAFEVFAVMALAGIIEDWNNNHHLKAIIGSVVFALAVVGCTNAGKHAFHLVTLDVQEANKVRQVKADREKALAVRLFAEAKPFELAGTDPGHPDYQRYHKLVTAAERAEKVHNDLSLEIEKNKLPPPWQIWMLLILFEVNKALGRWSAATPTSRTWTRAQRKAHKDKSKPKLAAVN